jgi:hypothetical protein
MPICQADRPWTSTSTSIMRIPPLSVFLHIHSPQTAPLENGIRKGVCFNIKSLFFEFITIASRSRACVAWRLTLEPKQQTTSHTSRKAFIATGRDPLKNCDTGYEQRTKSIRCRAVCCAVLHINDDRKPSVVEPIVPCRAVHLVST